MTDTLTHNNQIFHKATDAPKGKKATQVAKIIAELQKQPGVPLDFDQLCADAGQKYPQDIQACAFALEMTEQVDRYVLSSDVGHRGKTFYAWTGPTDPSLASA